MNQAKPFPRLCRIRRRGGFTLIEMLIAGLMITLIGVGLWTLVRSGYDSQFEMQGQNSVNLSARQAVDQMTDYLRGATALSAATASDVTLSTNAGQSVRFRVSGGKLVRTVTDSSGSMTSATVAPNIAAPDSGSPLAFTYYTWNGTSWVSSTAPATPANVGAVDFTVQSTWPTSKSVTRKISGSVRIRQK